MQASKEKKLLVSKCGDVAFTTRGFSNWKDAKVAFKNHEKTSCHKEAVQAVLVVPASHQDCAELLSSIHAKEKADNRQLLYKLLSTIRFLACQGLALRGDASEEDSNYTQLLGIDDPRIFEWVRKKTNKYSSQCIQNEMLTIMSLTILRKIVANVQSAMFYTIMVDETTDFSNKEQVVLVLRWVDCDFNVHEDFIGLYNVPSISANVLTSVIKDALQRLNLCISKVRGQCYDGASNMSGIKSGVAKQILDEEKRAIFTHCYGHALNLACNDAVNGCKILKRCS